MRTKFAFIVAHASEHAIRFMCRTLGITRSCYYAWQRTMPRRAERAARREARAALFEYIEIFYNRQQRHSSIGYRTPAQARMDITVAQAA